MNGPGYTQDELDTLKRMVDADVGDRAIAAVLGRTEYSVSSKRNAKGWHRPGYRKDGRQASDTGERRLSGTELDGEDASIRAGNKQFIRASRAMVRA